MKTGLPVARVSVLLLAAACGGGNAQPAPSQPAATPTPSPEPAASVVPKPTAEGGTIIYHVPREEVADLTGRALFDVAFIPEGFIENPDVVVTELTFTLQKTKNVARSWKWEEDPSIRFSIEERPHGNLGLGGKSESVVIKNDIIGELVLTGPKERTPYPVLFLVWKDKANYYLRAQTGGPLTEEVVLRIAASVQAQY